MKTRQDKERCVYAEFRAYSETKALHVQSDL